MVKENLEELKYVSFLSFFFVTKCGFRAEELAC